MLTKLPALKFARLLSVTNLNLENAIGCCWKLDRCLVELDVMSEEDEAALSNRGKRLGRRLVGATRPCFHEQHWIVPATGQPDSDRQDEAPRKM